MLNSFKSDSLFSLACGSETIKLFLFNWAQRRIARNKCSAAQRWIQGQGVYSGVWFSSRLLLVFYLIMDNERNTISQLGIIFIKKNRSIWRIIVFLVLFFELRKCFLYFGFSGGYQQNCLSGTAFKSAFNHTFNEVILAAPDARKYLNKKVRLYMLRWWISRLHILQTAMRSTSTTS